MRSARPAEAATNTTSSCWSRARFTSAIQSGHAAAEFGYRLTGDVLIRAADLKFGRSISIANCSNRTAEASRSRTVSDARNSRDGGAIDSGDTPRVLRVSLVERRVARANLLEEPVDCGVDLIRLGDDVVRPALEGEVLENRRLQREIGSGGTLGLAETSLIGTTRNWSIVRVERCVDGS